MSESLPSYEDSLGDISPEKVIVKPGPVVDDLCKKEDCSELVIPKEKKEGLPIENDLLKKEEYSELVILEKVKAKGESSLIINDLSKKEEYSELIIPEDRKFDSIMSDEMEADDRGPSKKSLKKEKKLQRYLDMKAARKARRKDKRKDRQERIKLGILNTSKTTKKVYSMAESNNKFTIVLDLSFGDYMNERDMSKCANQIARTYSANRRCPNPVQLHLCSFSDKIKEELTKIDGMDKWDVHTHEFKYLLYFERDKIVYLTSDSENVLETVEEDKVYVIGGFVDHNLHKGVSLQKARADGIRHARLPLQQNIVLNSRTVLAINHVFEILLAMANGAPWREAFRTVIPQRKIGTANPRRVKKFGKIDKLCKDE